MLVEEKNELPLVEAKQVEIPPLSSLEKKLTYILLILKMMENYIMVIIEQHGET